MHRDLNDIIPPSRRRVIDSMGEMRSPSSTPPPPPPPGPSMDMRPAAPAPHQSAPPPPPPTMSPVPPMAAPSRRPFKNTGFPFGTAIIALVVIIACGVALYAFGGAKVTIVPVANSATIAADMVATAGTGDLPFQLVTVEKTATANVPAESTITAADPATGKITISNTQAKPQALIKNTRFQTAAGLVFRIHDSVSIPAGGNTTVTVYADEAGDKYNIPATTFTVPGLSGSTAFTQVTAKSDAPMTGGFSGTRPSVSQATKDTQYAQIQAKLATDMQKDLAAKIPAGYVLIPGASFTTYTPQNDTAGASGTVTLTDQGDITAVIFPSDVLARAIAFKSVGTYGGQPVMLQDVSGLTVKPVLPSIAPDATEFDFNLSGSTTVLWQVDPTKIAGAIAGKSRQSAEVALQSFPEVSKATLVLRPFWAGAFPGDPAKIKVTVSNPQPAK